MSQAVAVKITDSRETEAELANKLPEDIRSSVLWLELFKAPRIGSRACILSETAFESEERI